MFTDEITSYLVINVSLYPYRETDTVLHVLSRQGKLQGTQVRYETEVLIRSRSSSVSSHGSPSENGL